MADGKFIKIYDWMNALDLKPTELIVFALIYAFNQQKKPFTGSYRYIRSWVNISHPTVCATLESLLEKGMIVKFEERKGAIKRCTYFISPRVKKFNPSESKNLTPTSQNSLSVTS